MEQIRAVIFNFNWDDKLGFHGRMVGGRWTGPAALASVVDVNLTNAPESCIKYFAEGGLAMFWPEAAHPDIHKPYDLPFEYDVSFVGGKYGWRPKFIARLQKMGIKVTPNQRFQGVYDVILEDGSKRIATRNLTPGRNVYGERLIRVGEEEYRLWDPFRSKIAAALLNDIEVLPIYRGSKILYLGAASGTTCSHVSDIIGLNGRVYCVEFSPRSIRDLITVCERRKNMVPILADARFPEEYSFICDEVDVIYSDVAQPDQAKILINNANYYLKPGGYIIIAVKARSIDVTKPPSEVFKGEMKLLSNNGFEIEGKVRLEPYTADHIFIVAKKT